MQVLCQCMCGHFSFRRGMGIPAYPGVCCSSCSLCMYALHGCIVSLSPVHARPEGLRGHSVDAEVWLGVVGLEVALW